MAKLALYWPIDYSGYDLDGTGRIRERRESTPHFRNVLKIDGLIRRLALMPDGSPRPANAKGALDFVTTYGFLGVPHGPESADWIGNCIRVARSVVRTIDKKDWLGLQRWALENARNIKLMPEFIYFEDEDKSDLFFGPTRFLDAIYLQALDDVAIGTELLRCDNPGCPEWFRVGPGTGHSRVRRKRRFCSPTCQKAFAYRLKKGEVQ